jgi:hypothetical protein
VVGLGHAGCEAAYAAAHKLDNEQMAWRRAKMAELKDPVLFKQEYPATADEAFQTTGHDSFIKPEDVLRAACASMIQPNTIKPTTWNILDIFNLPIEFPALSLRRPV